MPRAVPACLGECRRVYGRGGLYEHVGREGEVEQPVGHVAVGAQGSQLAVHGGERGRGVVRAVEIFTSRKESFDDFRSHFAATGEERADVCSEFFRRVCGPGIADDGDLVGKILMHEEL